MAATMDTESQAMTDQPRALSANAEYVLRHIYALENATVLALYDQYRAALQRLQGELAASFPRDSQQWSASDPEFRERTELLVRQIQAEMQALLSQSAQQIAEAGEGGYRAGSTGAAYTLDDSIRSITARLPLLPSEAIRAQLLAPYEGSTLIDRISVQGDQFAVTARQSLVQSQIQGESIAQATVRLADAFGIARAVQTPHREAHRALFNRVQMIARTEILRASNLGALATYQANADVLQGMEWLTAKDDRVCPICGPLDGRIMDLQGNPIDGRGAISAFPPAHPQCRCTIVPVVRQDLIGSPPIRPRQTFPQWAQSRGLTRNVYGQAFDFRGASPPRARQQAN